MFLVSETALTCIIGILLGAFLYRRRGQRRLPPGPRGLPLVGNLFQVPLKEVWLQFDSWMNDYGPILHLNLAGQSIIVLNSKKAATDLLERRAAIYSSRPRFIVAGEYLNGGCNISLVGYGDLWRRMRRSSEYALGLKTSTQYHPFQSDEAILLAHDLIHSSDQWKSHILRSITSSIITLVYNLPPLTSADDPIMVFLLDIVKQFSEAMYPGAYAVEFLPIFDRMPPWIAGWKRKAIKDHQKYTVKLEKMFSNVKNTVMKGDTEQFSFCATLFKPGARHGLSDYESSWLAATLLMAGYETTSSTLMWFMYCMLLFPNIQAKAQEELDRVVGKSRLPSFTDAKHLPYIWAIIKEILRWRPPVPIGVPHATVAVRPFVLLIQLQADEFVLIFPQDDYYEGYFIPKNSIVISNIWSINRDPEVYSDRIDEFIPERHLDSSGMLKDVLDEGHFAFGFGHRYFNFVYISDQGR
ncbi:hypothetical protein VKT23_014515 [Stygiomarasmius scandens]|uniref:Cytochrome P450 n=1 Tax=Marasmiellus scandens TaxID=2682957 RepID=A0ABR1J4W9_9AGAR